jgi:hypothetical protein
MKPIKCCGYYCCVYVPPDESEYPKRKVKKDFSLKFDEVMQKERIEATKRSLSQMNIKTVPEEIKIDNRE